MRIPPLLSSLADQNGPALPGGAILLHFHRTDGVFCGIL